MSDRFIAEALAEACEAWYGAHWGGEPLPRELRVSASVYDSIVDAKADELARGNPLLLLGLDLVRVEALPPEKIELV